MTAGRDRAEAWVSECLEDAGSWLVEAIPAGGKSGCEVWDCLLDLDGQRKRAILKVYTATFDDYSKLGPARTARKNALALTEFRGHSVPVPKLLGMAARDGEAAILYEKVPGKPWCRGTRVEAAAVLAGIHRIGLSDLSPDLSGLVEQSTPNRRRVLLGLEMASRLDERSPGWRQDHPDLSSEVDSLIGEGEPDSGVRALVHGDYFSANLVPSQAGAHVIDWDLLAVGDPMWDLGFLVGADRGIDEDEAGEVIDTYRRDCPVDDKVLAWHRRCWDAFWRLRDLPSTSMNA